MSQTPSVAGRMAVMPEPTAGVPRELLPHVHLVSTARFPTVPHMPLSQACEFLTQAPRLRDTQPVRWMYLNAPQVGSIMLVWQSHAEFGTDGYVWGAPEQSFTREFKGYTIEVRVQKYGYLSPNEVVTQHTRYRYRIISGPPNFDQMLWIVHYTRSEPDDQIAINRIQISPQIQQSLAMRRTLQSHGNQLARRDFWLQDRNSWSTLSLPPQMARGGGYPPHMMGGRPSGPGYHPGQPGMPQVKQMKSRGTYEFSLDDEETATGDFLDIMSPRDISRVRYKCNHEWMEEIFASPYRTHQITPVDLGLGRKGELAALTMPFFDAPIGIGKPSSATPEDAKKEYIGRLPPGKAQEFTSAATKKIADMEAEMEKMKEKHARRLEKLMRLKRLSEAESALRDAFMDPSDTGSEPWRVEGYYHDTSGDITSRYEADISLPRLKVADVVHSLETALNKTVVPTSDVTCVQKGSLSDQPGRSISTENGINDPTNATNNQSEGARSSAQLYTTNAENTGDEDTEMGGMDTSKPDAAHAASNSEGQGWVMVPKDETNTSAQSSTDKAGGPTTGQDNTAQ
ncbi:hypothetical protein KEM56_002443, partial [Ascosphaera pollenicola]